jgi:hypothetical protein
VRHRQGEDDNASTGLWYQAEPHAPYPPMPEIEALSVDRIPPQLLRETKPLLFPCRRCLALAVTSPTPRPATATNQPSAPRRGLRWRRIRIEHRCQWLRSQSRYRQLAATPYISRLRSPSYHSLVACRCPTFTTFSDPATDPGPIQGDPT